MTDPASGRNRPAMQLMNVVLPEPFGPMMPMRSPSETSTEIPDRAANEPKRLVTFRADSSGTLMRSSV